MTLTIDAEVDHGKLLAIQDRATGSSPIIAFHPTALGAAVGGMRYRRYSSRTQAMVDSLRRAVSSSLAR